MNEILEEAGIKLLTGEADKLMMRVLCDLTPAGCAVVNKFLGGNVTFTSESNWNSGAVASVLLPYSCLSDLETFIKFMKTGHCDRNVHQMSGRTY